MTPRSLTVEQLQALLDEYPAHQVVVLGTGGPPATRVEPGLLGQQHAVVIC